MILKPTPVSSQELTYVAGQNLLVGEASTVGPLGRVYDDAMDVGCTVISHRTGKAVTYVVDGVERDREGEVLYDILVPADLRERAELPVLHLVND